MLRPRTVLAFVLMLPLTCVAWGPTGHRAVGHVAEQHLTKKARNAVAHILGPESLAMSSTWMDDIRSDRAYDHTHDWHWVTVPDSSTYAQSAKNPEGDVVEAIERMKATLRSDTATMEHKRSALRMLVHLVGDIHQPLHVGRGDDKGGNDFQVRWFKNGSNLHRVWDSGMIDERKLSYTELAHSIDHATRNQVSAWQRHTTVEWTAEAVLLRPKLYPAEKGADIGYEYMYANWPTVEQQLLKAGIRLAGVLNDLFR
jgi:hypothetical protein